MAGKGLTTYTPKEASNISTGQIGSVWLDIGKITPEGEKSGTLFQPENGVIIAITAMQNSTFVDLITEDDTKYVGGTGTGYESGGDTFHLEDNSGSGAMVGVEILKGITIYGRWTGVRVYYNSDADGDSDDGVTDYSRVLCYIGA